MTTRYFGLICAAHAVNMIVTFVVLALGANKIAAGISVFSVLIIALITVTIEFEPEIADKYRLHVVEFALSVIGGISAAIFVMFLLCPPWTIISLLCFWAVPPMRALENDDGI
jgi:hypothetical protein